jgi:iron complex outermembrane recepter protein
MQLRSVKCFTAVAGLALGTSGSLCTASDTTVGDQSGALEEIVVTARRQSEDLEKVPVAVVALSRSALIEQHVTNEQELQTAVPGLLTVASTSTNELAFSIRGQALDAYSFTSPTALAYFDEFQTGGVTSTTFFDLQSVQVLKGIQGTLFGRNATGVLFCTRPRHPARSWRGISIIPLGISMSRRWKVRSRSHSPSGLRFA